MNILKNTEIYPITAQIAEVTIQNNYLVYSLNFNNPYSLIKSMFR